MEQKLCRICGNLKDVYNFTKNGKMADGYRNECRECSNKLYNDKKRRRELNLQKKIKLDGNKICRICRDDKPLSEYHLKIGTTDGHRHECKECVKVIQKKYKEADGFKEKDREYQKKRYEEKREEILQDKKDYHIKNKETILEKKKEYRSDPENKERIKDYLVDYRENHRDEAREYAKKYQVENRDKYYEYRRNNPHCIAWRSVLHSTLKRLGTFKQDHTINMLGYSALDLKCHLEKQFTKI